MSQHRENSGGFGKRSVLGVEEKRPLSFIQKLAAAFDFTQPLESQEIMIFTARLGAVPASYFLLLMTGVAIGFLKNSPAMREMSPELVAGFTVTLVIFGPIVIAALLFLWIRQSVWAASALFATCAIHVSGFLGGKLEPLLAAVLMLALSVVALRGALSLSRASRHPIQ